MPFPIQPPTSNPHPQTPTLSNRDPSCIISLSFRQVVVEGNNSSAMPVYEYECRNCGVRFEHLQRMRDDPLKLCPECSEEALFRVIQPVGVIFKGSGFYVTDNRGRNSTGPAVRPESTKEGKETPSTTSAAPASSEGGTEKAPNPSPAPNTATTP